MSDPVPSPPPRWLVLGLAALTLVAVGALSLVLFRGDLERVDDEGGAAGGAAPAPPGEPPVADAFDRADGPLADDDHRWTILAGEWAVADGRAGVVAIPADGPALATLPDDGAAPVAGVTATAVEPGWGFAFRVRDAANFWAVAVDEGGQAWEVVVVEGGDATEVSTELTRPPADGTPIEVVEAGDRLRITVGGETVEVDDSRHADAADVGLVALIPENPASMAWDDVRLAAS